MTTNEAAAVRLRPPRNLVDRRAVRMWTADALISVAIPLIILGVLAFFIESARTWLVIATVVVAVVGAAYVVVMPRWRYRVHRWETTDDAVYTSSGWLWQEWRVAPMSRIQTVDTARDPFHQMFGLSTVTVTTASAAGHLKISGLDREVASDMVRRLTETTQATPGDAT